MGIDEHIFDNIYLILGVVCLVIVVPYARDLVLETASDKVLFFGFVGLLLLIFQEVVDFNDRLVKLENIVGRRRK